MNGLTAVWMVAFAATALAQQDAAVLPFTAEMQTVHAQGPGGAPLIQEVFYARRGDGSYVMHQQVTNPDGVPGTMVNILDKRTHRSITLYPTLRASLTFYQSDQAMKEWQWKGVDTCGSMQRLGDLRKWGQRVTTRLIGREALQVASEDPKDGQRTEWWVAEELDCFPLQKTITGGRGSPQQTTVTWLIEGEPVDALLAVPPEYVEMSPVELEAAYAAKYAGAALFGQMLELMQRRYEESLLRWP